jgi:predicted DNA-binding ribbon-helix-helix protein
MENVKTTITLPEPQWRAAKNLATARHCTLAEVVSEALAVLLDALDAKDGPK